MREGRDGAVPHATRGGVGAFWRIVDQPRGRAGRKDGHGHVFDVVGQLF